LARAVLDYVLQSKHAKLVCALQLSVNHSLEKHTPLWLKVALQLQWET
jgi:hypothetical protein